MRYIFHLLNCEVKFTHAGYGTSFTDKKPGRPFAGIVPSALGDKNIFMHRNPLDTAVSFFFQIHKHDRVSFNRKSALNYLELALRKGLPPKDMNKFVLHPVWGVENICRFNRAWLDFFDKRPDSLVVSYEDAKRDPASAVEQLVRFTGCPPVDVAAIVRQTDFDSMKQLEITGKSRELRLYGQRSGDPETMKVRKGVVRGYRDYLSPETIAAAGQIASRFQFEI